MIKSLRIELKKWALNRLESMRLTFSKTIIQFYILLDLKVDDSINLAYASIQNNTFVVCGESETKTIKDLLPGIIEQLGPKQHKVLQ